MAKAAAKRTSSTPPPSSKKIKKQEQDQEQATEKREDIYQAEGVVGKRIIRGQVQYKVKWFGYPMEQCTWEPEENIAHCQDFIEAFEEEQKEKKTKKPKKIPAKKVSSAKKAGKGSEEGSEDRDEEVSVGEVSTEIRVSSSKEAESEPEPPQTVPADAAQPVSESSADSSTNLHSDNGVSVPEVAKEDPKVLEEMVRSVGIDTSDLDKSILPIPIPSLASNDDAAECAELRRLAPRIVQIVGMSFYPKDVSSADQDAYAVIHFRGDGGNNVDWIKPYPLRHVRQAIPDKLLWFYHQKVQCQFAV